MIQVLFVDDDTSVLGDIRDMLIAIGANWNICLASSGESAVRMLQNGFFDVVVSDMKMPGMDGVELLTYVRDEYPQAMRILMTGNADVAFTAQLAPQAHQFLHKPCQPSVLKATIERTYELGRRLIDPELRRTLGQITDLPRPSKSILRLNSLLDSPDADAVDVAQAVEHDMAMTAKLFQLVNSAYYGLSRTIQDVHEAVAYLGLNTVRNLAVSVEMFRSISATAVHHEEVIQDLYDHGSQVASLARQLVLVREHANEAFVAGLLHDVGMLALVSYFPDRFDELQQVSSRSGLPICDLEFDIVGATHADIGAYLLNLWGLPFNVVEAVARHHDAMQMPQRKMDPTHAVCIAEAIVGSNAGVSGRSLHESNNEALETAYLKELGVLERVAVLLVSSSDPEPVS